ncbi:hypothetical protein GQ53DRAFT_215396 [Thozetella sp. PMI_491]|nr:hypothetical protein GQ53DRAFT_215396 [Thozetella sp. PMI_491]
MPSRQRTCARISQGDGQEGNYNFARVVKMLRRARLSLPPGFTGAQGRTGFIRTRFITAMGRDLFVEHAGVTKEKRKEKECNGDGTGKKVSRYRDQGHIEQHRVCILRDDGVMFVCTFFRKLIGDADRRGAPCGAPCLTPRSSALCWRFCSMISVAFDPELLLCPTSIPVIYA